MKALTVNSKQRTKFPAQTPVDNLPAPGQDLSLLHLQAEMTRIDALIGLAIERWQQAGHDPTDAFRGLTISDEEAGRLLALPFGGNWGSVAESGSETDSDVLASIRAVTVRHTERLGVLACQRGEALRLQQLVRVFELDDFEQDALLICLAPTLDLRYEQIYGYLQNDIGKKQPRVSLLLELLCGPNLHHLSRLGVFADNAPLIEHQLLTYVPVSGGPQPQLLAQPLTVDKTIVSWLLGKYRPNAEFIPHMHLEHPIVDEENQILAGLVEASINHAVTITHPLLIFHGADQAAQQAAARLLAARLGQPLLVVDLANLLAQGKDVQQILRLVLRDARLNCAAAYFQGWDACMQEQNVPGHILRQLYAHPGTIVMAGRLFWQPQGVERDRTVLTVEFSLPDYAQRKELWVHYLQSFDAMGVDVDPIELAGRFTLGTAQIRDAVVAARDLAVQRGAALQQKDFYVGARLHSSGQLSDLARKITPRYDWDDIILPADQLQILRELVAMVRGRSKVLEEWGLGKKLASSAAVTVLFAGPPGTGKTMAAEVIAKDLALDLYKIDLSSLVSKYIGETEKNLERVFSEAQSSNAILFFDEADAIFGKRSGVKDARDRYANIEISYLLQRMEIYDGVTILATNLRSNLDEAFMRRIQFAVDIPFPDEKDRARIWSTLFPEHVPHASDINLDEMAHRFKLAGGNIRNIIVNAAYMAAADGGVITMQHLLHSTRREFQKMGRLISENQMQVENDPERLNRPA